MLKFTVYVCAITDGGVTYRQRVGLHQRSCSTSGPVNTWMGDHFRAGNPSRYVASHHLGRLSLPSLQGRLIESLLAVARRGAFTCVEWQVTLCDPA